jgi:hypothetical protein
MLLIAKILNFVSGLIVLMTGVYVEVRFEQMLSEVSQLLVAGLAFGYFCVQLFRLLTEDGQTSTTSTTTASPKEFIA